jgi:hypothetical protein
LWPIVASTADFEVSRPTLLEIAIGARLILQISITMDAETLHSQRWPKMHILARCMLIRNAGKKTRNKTPANFDIVHSINEKTNPQPNPE